MKFKTIFLLSFFILFNLNLQAGNGSGKKSITGTISDVRSGETLAGALISVVGTDIKTYSDFDGNFVIEDITDGPVEIKVSLVSYKEYIVKDTESSSSTGELDIKLMAF